MTVGFKVTDNLFTTDENKSETPEYRSLQRNQSYENKNPKSVHRTCLLLLLLLPAVVQAQDAYSTNADGSIYTYSTNADGSANIVAYAGPSWVVTIPTHINGLTVTTISNGEGSVFPSGLTSVTIPNAFEFPA